MNLEGLTNRQREAVSLRCEQGATLAQIASWLGISRRAVLYRLEGARKRSLEAAAKSGPLPEKRIVPAKQSFRWRRYNASQIISAHNHQPMSLDNI